MTTLTREQKLIRNGLIEEAAKRHPGDYQAAIKEGMQRFRVMLQRGLTEAVAPNTSTNKLNDPDFANAMNDVGGNSFEAFLTMMIEVIAAKAAADGKINPAYTKLAAQLAAAQAQSASGVQRSSYVNPAAGSTPVGRTESAHRAGLTEALAYAGLALPQGTPAQPAAAAPAPRALDQMTQTELQHEHMARLGLLHREGALRSPFYSTAAA
jgi:hypothetical protein